jgi:hypothetical protein
MDGRLYTVCSFSAQVKKLLVTARNFSPVLLPLKGVLPRGRHHPFSRQTEQRYNTLDFACGKIVCQGACSPFGYPAIFSQLGTYFRKLPFSNWHTPA